MPVLDESRQKVEKNKILFVNSYPVNVRRISKPRWAAAILE
jgi:hypothetical protein